MARTHPARAPQRTTAASTLTLHRQLTPSQRERRQRIVDAAMELAAGGGYEAVQMKSVAAHAEVSLGTLYRYFSSKDHLLAEALVAWGSVLGARLRSSPPRGQTPASRVASVFRRMARGVEESPQLGIALTRALLTPDPSVFANREDLVGVMHSWIDLALGDAAVPDREGVIQVLQHVCFSSMISLSNGQKSPREIGDELERAVRLLLDR